MIAGYVDPSLGPATTDHEREVYAAVVARGYCLHRLHASTRAVRLTGPGGAHITATSIAWIKTDRDIQKGNTRAREST